MDFSKTFYARNSSKIKLFSPNNLVGNYIRDNKSEKKLFYITHYRQYNSFSTSPTKSSSKNCITKNTLKSINKLMSEKLEKSREIKTQLKTFYKEEIKIKIRKSNKYKSLFEKTEISNSNNLNPELEKKLINSKLKSNKKRFNYFITKTNISNNLNLKTFTNLNASISPKTNKNTSKTYKNDKDISKANNNINKSLNLPKGQSINKTHYATTYFTKELNNDNNIKKEKAIRNKIINENISEKNKIRRHPPYSIDFREKNLINFYTQMKSLCYQKYCLYLHKNELEAAKMKSDLVTVLGNTEILKYTKFYNLFKPYNTNLERYLIFLKETIYSEFKEKERLKLVEANLVTDIIILRKHLMNMHKTLKSYIDDKFFLLCVKNATLNKDNFKEKYKLEFEIDLQNLETLKNYINEISELTNEEKILKKNKKLLEINLNNNNKKKRKEIPFISKIEKIRANFEASFNHSLTFENLFDTAEEFINKINSSERRIENLLRKNNESEMEMANMTDFISHHSREIENSKEEIIIQENIYKKYEKDLIEAKRKNKYLVDYRNKIMKLKKYNISNKIIKKIKSVIYNIINTNDKTVKEILVKKTKKNKENINLLLKNLENAIIFLINFKQGQKINNTFEYSKVIKIMEKHNRLSIIEQKKEELKIKNENKLRKIIEKNLKVFLLKDKRTSVEYKPIKKMNDNSLKKNKDEEKSYDVFY